MYFVVGEKTQTRYSAILFVCCAVLLYSAPATSLQEIHTLQAAPAAPPMSVANNTSDSALDRSATVRKPPAGTQGGRMKQPLPPSDQATQPATVTIRDGKLTVEANNSDLTQILQYLANISGMTVHGLGKGPRIYGVYGPGALREVIATLLVGSGYNFIMVGGAGTLRELQLSAEKNDAPATALATPAQVPSPARNERVQQEFDTTPSVQAALGPGAVVPSPSLDQQDDDTRTQNNLQRLQHIQNQQMQNTPQ